jgi:multiple sugar transport system permease protein
MTAISEAQVTGVGGKRRKKRNLAPFFFLVPAIILLVPIGVFPILYVLRLSVFEANLNKAYLGDIFVGLNNFRDFVLDTYTWKTLLNSLVFTVSTVTLELLVGLGAALLLQKESRFMSVVRALILLPLVMTPVVVGVLWRMMYQAEFGIIPYFLGLLGIPSISFLATPSLAMPALIVVSLWEYAPFMILIILAGLKALPTEPLEAAAIDGASDWQMLRYVVLPMLKPVILIGLLIRSIDAFKILDLMFVTTRGGPGNVTETISLRIYYTAFRFFHMGYAAALTIILIIMINIAVIVLLKLFRSTQEELAV